MSKQRRRRPTFQQHSSNLALTGNSRKKNFNFLPFLLSFFSGGEGEFRIGLLTREETCDSSMLERKMSLTKSSSVEKVVTSFQLGLSLHKLLGVLLRRAQCQSWCVRFLKAANKASCFLPFHINTMPSLFDNLNYLINLQIFNTYVTEYLQNRIQPHSQDHFLGWGQLKKPKDKSLGTRLPRRRTHGFYLMYYLTRTQQRTEYQTRGGKT